MKNNYLETISKIIAEFEHNEDIDAADRIIGRTLEIRREISAECGEDSDEMHEACNLIAQKCLPIVQEAQARLAGKKFNEEEVKRIKGVALRFRPCLLAIKN